MTEFVWPWMIVLAPLPWLLRWWLRPASPGQALHLPHPGVHLDTPERQGRGGWRTWLLVLAWLALLVAAARPQWVGPPQAQQRSGRALMLAPVVHDHTTLLKSCASSASNLPCVVTSPG